MTDPQPGDLEQLRAENERLRAEIDRLRAELQRLGRYLREPPPAARDQGGAPVIDWGYQRGDLEDDLGDD